MENLRDTKMMKFNCHFQHKGFIPTGMKRYSHSKEFEVEHHSDLFNVANEYAEDLGFKYAGTNDEIRGK